MICTDPADRPDLKTTCSVAKTMKARTMNNRPQNVPRPLPPAVKKANEQEEGKADHEQAPPASAAEREQAAPASPAGAAPATPTRDDLKFTDATPPKSTPKLRFADSDNKTPATDELSKPMGSKQFDASPLNLKRTLTENDRSASESKHDDDTDGSDDSVDRAQAPADIPFHSARPQSSSNATRTNARTAARTAAPVPAPAPATSTPSTPSTPSFYLLADYSTSSLDTISLTVFDSRDVMRGSFEWTVPWPVHVGEESAGTESGDAGAAQAVVVRIRNKTVTVAKGKEGDYFKLPSPFSGNLLEIVPASREQEKGVSGGGSSDKCYYAGDVVCRITAVGVTIEVSEEGGRRYA